MGEENAEGNEGDNAAGRSGQDENIQSNGVSSSSQSPASPVQSTSQNTSQSRQLPPQAQMPLPPRPPVGRQGHTGDDILHQYYVRGLLVLVIAIGIGYLYLHLESPSLSRHKLVPNEFSSFRKASVGSRKSSEQIKPVKSPPPPVVSSEVTEEDDSPPPVRHDSRGKPYIDPKFHEHSRYLSQVLHTLGDISRRMEIGENITKPIGGIVEMRAELLDEEEEDENVPEYMKRLGSIIDDMSRSKKTNGKYEKFKSSITKSHFSDPDKLKERNEKRKKWKEEMLAEQAEAEMDSTYSWNPLDDDMEVVGENDDEIVPYELTEEDYASLSGDEFKKIEENLDKFWKKYEEDMMEEEPEDDRFGEDDDIDSVGRKSDESIERLLERADKLKMGLEMLKVMFELEEKESSKRNTRRRSKEEGEKKPVFRDENSYTL